MQASCSNIMISTRIVAYRSARLFTWVPIQYLSGSISIHRTIRSDFNATL